MLLFGFSAERAELFGFGRSVILRGIDRGY